jgi:glycosyltransferase involved in cell wall biosynthesis
MAAALENGGLRIAFLAWRDLPNSQAGGSEVVVDNLARGLLARGHEVTLLAGAPIGAHPYPARSMGGKYSQYLRAPLTFWRHARDADVVVDVENGVPFFSPLWQRAPTVCLVHHVHTEQWGMHFPAPVAAVGRWLESVAMQRVYRRAAFVADSSSTAHALADVGITANRITTIRLGFDPVEIVGPPAPEPRFLVLGRLVPHKRVERALELWPRVRAKIGGELVIVGDGPERDRLRAVAGEGVTFTGSVSDVAKGRELGAAWLLVHPAHHEGWGVVIIEAAAAGVPTIAYNVEGVRDAVVDGETGILAADDDAFVDAWVQLATDDARRARMADACVARAARFTWDATVDRFEAVVREAAARGRKA